MPKPLGRTLMVQGTSSSAGKSLLVAALCRCFARRGVRVAPFKAQNMSNNAAVCADGSEIGRSQALQAIAASVPPHADMNPILLKPEGDSHSQVVLNGRPYRSLSASEYFQRKGEFWGVVTGAIDRLREQYELVIIEGAGSPAEINLTDVEIVNMAVARYCQSPVILVGDIERGGVFAQLLGTLWLLPPNERSLVKGLIVNKFRGDLRLFDRGVELLQERGGVAVLGVLPWIQGLSLPEEDAIALLDAACSHTADGDGSAIDIAVIHFPHIANFDDFDPLANERAVNLRYVRSSEQLQRPDVILLPGTKNTLGDLKWLRDSGLDQRILACASQGTKVVGICGGYQMLGKTLDNPNRLESEQTCAPGLGLLDVTTTFQGHKQTFQVSAMVLEDSVAPGVAGECLTGYEIHVGRTESSSAWLRLTRRDVDGEHTAMDGARSATGTVWGCYLHGLFHNDAFRIAWLRSLGVKADDRVSRKPSLEDSLEQLADAFEKHIDLKRLEQIIKNTEQAHVNAG
ncbi:MAG: cobyric acid synthase [Planctomycetaceae bacterium]